MMKLIAGLQPPVKVEEVIEESKPLLRIEDLVDHHVLKMMLKNGNNLTRTAEMLGISRVTLYRRMRKLGIERRQYVRRKD